MNRGEIKGRRAAGSTETDRTALLRTPFASRPQWRQERAYPISSWSGVEVNSLGRVIKLDLHGKNIKCTFPKDLCQLDALQELVLHTNRISGVLSPHLRNLRALEVLDLWDNFLEGPIPVEIAELRELRELHLSGNFFTGLIPKELGRLSKLTVLFLHGNKLEGTIPPELGQLRRLQKLVLINNRLTGAIPVELAKLKSLVDLNLANNRLSGPIPAELGQLSNLMRLYLWGNNLSGSIPEELGKLSLLERLDLAQNQLLMSGGGIPLSLRKHRNFRRFVFAVLEDGAPIPLWRSKRSVVPALALGYLDLLTDVLTALSYRQEEEEKRMGRAWSVMLALVFILAPALVSGAFVFRRLSLPRRLAVALQLGLLAEAFQSFREQSYSQVLVALRVIQSLFQSLPMLLLQGYMLLVSPEHLGLRLFSASVSAISVSLAATSIIVEHPLSQIKWARGVAYPSATFWRASRVVFSTVQYVGSVIVRGGFRVHPQDYVWFFIAYQAMELIARLGSIAVLALVAEFYVLVVLVWLWATRWYISNALIGVGTEQENLRFRALLRVVGMPFMDSVLDRPSAYKLSCALTVVETIAFLTAGNSIPALSGEETAHVLVDRMRRVFTVVSILFTAGKVGMAIALVVPFKKKIGKIAPAETGELRMDNDEESSSRVKSSRGGSGGNKGGNIGTRTVASIEEDDESDEDENKSIRVLWNVMSVNAPASHGEDIGEEKLSPMADEQEMENLSEGMFSPALAVTANAKLSEKQKGAFVKPPLVRRKSDLEGEVSKVSAACRGKESRQHRRRVSESMLTPKAKHDAEEVEAREEESAGSERAPISSL